MGLSLSEALLRRKAKFVADYQDTHGGLEGVNTAWTEAEATELLEANRAVQDAELLEQAAARERAEAARRLAETPRPDTAPAPPRVNRSALTPAQKAEYVGKHGLEAFQALPE